MNKVKIENRPFGPFPIVLVGADVNGKPNYAAAGAYGVVTLSPILYVSLKSTHYTTAGIRKNGFFTINVPSIDLACKTDYCGMVSGKTVDKSRVFESFYDKSGKAPMIVECPMNFLCKVVKSVPINGFEMFFGKMIATYFDRRCLTKGKPDTKKIKPLVITGDGNYWSLGRAVGTIFKEGLLYKK
jgi:flavin reductase (DIM6/NTAB) family NADH-FMN oxidoreductase RutF